MCKTIELDNANFKQKAIDILLFSNGLSGRSGRFLPLL